MTLALGSLVEEFARMIQVVDSRCPRAKEFMPGIGPHEEPDVVRLVTEAMAENKSLSIKEHSLGVSYPGTPRQKCDWSFTSAEETWFVEVKMARFKGNNGKPADSTVTHLISPYDRDRSALYDTVKLATSKFQGRKAILVYGYDFVDITLDPVIDALELLASHRVQLGPRHTATFSNLIHPVHQQGRVFAWEICGTADQ